MPPNVTEFVPRVEPKLDPTMVTVVGVAIGPLVGLRLIILGIGDFAPSHPDKKYIPRETKTTHKDVHGAIIFMLPSSRTLKNPVHSMKVSGLFFQAFDKLNNFQ